MKTTTYGDQLYCVNGLIMKVVTCLRSRMILMGLTSGKLFGSLTLSSFRTPDSALAMVIKSAFGLTYGLKRIASLPDFLSSTQFLMTKIC